MGKTNKFKLKLIQLNIYLFTWDLHPSYHLTRLLFTSSLLLLNLSSALSFDMQIIQLRVHIVRNATAHCFLEKISSPPPLFWKQVICHNTPSNAFFLQSTLGCSTSLVLIHPLASQLSGRLFNLLLVSSFPVFNLSYLCLSYA